MNIDLSVMEILYCWQSIVLSAGVHVATRSMKNVLLLLAGANEVRQAWAKHVALPVVPLFLGMLAAVVFPLHPAQLIKYVEQDHVKSPWLVYAAYGGAIGTFADYIHHRISGVLKVKEAITTNKDEAKE